MLMRFDPFRELDRWSRQLGGGPVPSLPMDAYRRGDKLIAHFDLPGVAPDSIELTIEKNVLNVRAERSRPDVEKADWLVAERAQGSVSRELFLGDNLDTGAMEAHYDQGVLTVTIPVAEAAKPRRVEVTTGGGRQAIDAGSAAA